MGAQGTVERPGDPGAEGKPSTHDPSGSLSADVTLAPPTAAGRLGLVLASVAMLAVVLGLAILAWTTANPIVLSPAQIERADDVIIGAIEAQGEHRVRIVRVFKGNLSEGDEIRVLNLPPESLRAGQEYILPLTPIRRERQVTPHSRVTVLNQRGVAPPEVLIYPAVPEAINRLKAILREGVEQGTGRRS